MALITIGTNLLDTSDIALVAPRGALSTVYLADSLQLESALSAADQAAAVNAAASATLTTAVVSSNFGSCYINGLNVQRVLGDGGAGTTWYLRGGPGAVVCPSTDLTVAQALIAAASGGGGGIVTADEYQPSVLGFGDVIITAGPGDNGNWSVVEIASTGEARNTVIASGVVSLTSPGGEAGNLGTVSLPVAVNSDGSLSLTVTAIASNDGSFVQMGIELSDAAEIQLDGTLAAGVNVFANVVAIYNRSLA